MKRKSDEKEIKKLLSSKIESTDLEDLWSSLENKATQEQIRALKKQISSKAEEKSLISVKKTISSHAEQSEIESTRNEFSDHLMKIKTQVSRIKKCLELNTQGVQKAQLEAREALETSSDKVKRTDFEKLKTKFLKMQKYDSKTVKNMISNAINKSADVLTENFKLGESRLRTEIKNSNTESKKDIISLETSLKSKNQKIHSEMADLKAKMRQISEENERNMGVTKELNGSLMDLFKEEIERMQGAARDHMEETRVISQKVELLENLKDQIEKLDKNWAKKNKIGKKKIEGKLDLVVEKVKKVEEQIEERINSFGDDLRKQIEINLKEKLDKKDLGFYMVKKVDNELFNSQNRNITDSLIVLRKKIGDLSQKSNDSKIFYYN